MEGVCYDIGLNYGEREREREIYIYIYIYMYFYMGYIGEPREGGLKG